MTAQQRLNEQNLLELPVSIERPGYDRTRLTTGIVHLGLGNFHRAHQAVYTDSAVRAGDPRWGILGASLRSPATRDALAPQDGLYALSVRDAGSEHVRVVGSIRQLVVANEAPPALIAAMTAPSVKIVSLTVTEKGYCHDPASATLQEDHPDVLHDLAHPEQPRSALGFLAAAIAQRRADGIAPFTVLCCDNVPANGRTVKRVLTRFAALRDSELGRYVADAIACPSTMVDRIVPATTEDDRTRIAGTLGCHDAWPVVTEPFSQWVVEDDFADGRPDWAAHGVTFASDVVPYERMKLRLLNGAHSSLAYLGYLAGFETVADAMADVAVASFVVRLMHEEVTPVLQVPAGADVDAYKRALIERFRNPALRHRTWQIAMDGSQKLPQRLLESVRDRLAVGLPFPCLALGIAAWMRYVTGRDEQGREIDVRDPLRDELRRRADAAGPVASRLAPALLSMATIFGQDLPADPRFVSAITAALDALFTHGAATTLNQLTARQTLP
jgi:fructuronate reductase